MSEDRLRPGQRGVIQPFPGTAGDLTPTDQNPDVEGHRAPRELHPTDDPIGAPMPVHDVPGEDDVEGHGIYRPGSDRGE